MFLQTPRYLRPISGSDNGHAFKRWSSPIDRFAYLPLMTAPVELYHIIKVGKL